MPGDCWRHFVLEIFILSLIYIIIEQLFASRSGAKQKLPALTSIFWREISYGSISNLTIIQIGAHVGNMDN